MQSMAELSEKRIEIRPEPTPALLAMRGICKSYGEHKVLDAVDLDLAPGEKVAVIGPSGSGKTTILRLAIGLVKPDAGTILIDGKYLWHEHGPDGLVQRANGMRARCAARSASCSSSSTCFRT